MARDNLLKLIRDVSVTTQIDNIGDVTINSVNADGTFDIKLPSGAIKRKAFNMRDDVVLRIGDVVNVTFVGKAKETAKIVGKSQKKKQGQKVVLV